MKVEDIAGIEQFDSPGKGRGLRVSRAYGVGELLFSCPAYSYVLSVKERGLICEQCFTRSDFTEFQLSCHAGALFYLFIYIGYIVDYFVTFMIRLLSLISNKFLN